MIASARPDTGQQPSSSGPDAERLDRQQSTGAPDSPTTADRDDIDWSDVARHHHRRAIDSINAPLTGIPLTDDERRFIHRVAWDGGGRELASLLAKARLAPPCPDSPVRKAMEPILGPQPMHRPDVDAGQPS